MTVPRDQAAQLILDIGTHKILGLAVRPNGDKVEVMASSMVRHTERSMRDGQVHDVAAVARSVLRVVEELERSVDPSFELKFAGASVAAAGRALKTSRGRAEVSHPGVIDFTADMERVLTWEAVADAQARLVDDLPAVEHSKGYYAVAHTVTGCWLDGDWIGSLAGQRGREFALEALATFLPGVVVDSLESVLVEAGLEMRGLTLEPIAALEAVIPPTARHLHLALVDIGAGTSDIALTGNGRVEAFAMVPQAGDAITEAVSTSLLLDFSLAEHVKRKVGGGETVSAESVLGESITVDPALLSELIGEPTRRLAQAIAGEIGEWAPERLDAVLLVGGGSRTPGLAEQLAAYLDLPIERVAVRDRRAVRGVVGAEHLSGPDAITALGIALRTCRQEEMAPVRVRVNDRPVCLFLPDRCTVREAARVAGLAPADLAGRLGPGITLTLNGEVVVVPGSRGEPAVARIDGEVVSLDTLLQNQDEVVLEPPKPGLPARPTVEEVVDEWLKTHAGRPGWERPRVRLMGEWQEVPVWVSRNGRSAKLHESVSDRDVLEIRWPKTARELVEATGRFHESRGVCFVNGRPLPLADFAGLKRNGEPAALSDPVEDGDTWEWESFTPPTVAQLIQKLGGMQESVVDVTINGQPVSIRTSARVLLNGVSADAGDPVADGDRIEVQATQSVSLYEVLPYAGIPSDAQFKDGRRLMIKVNDAPADFTTPLFQGDRIAIGFVKHAAMEVGPPLGACDDEGGFRP